MQVCIQVIKIARFNIYIGILSAFVLFSCNMQSTADTSESKAEVDEVSVPEDKLDGEASRDIDPTNSRGLDMAVARVGDFSFQEKFPQLYSLLSSNPDLLTEVEVYAKEVVLKTSIKSETDILAVLETRDEKIMPQLLVAFENMDQSELDGKWEGFSKELGQLGIEMTSAEGMFTGLGATQMLEAEVAAFGSEAFRHYMKFVAAHTQSMSGEYRFLDMGPFKDMVLAGEQIRKLAPNVFIEKTEDRFQSALEVFMDVHLVSDPTARQDASPQAYVVGTSIDAYPYMSETKTANSFASETSESKYKRVMERILENTSSISNRPENIYVIVVEWADSEEMGRSRVYNHLNNGEDVPHCLRIRRGDGTDKYAISYRFFEDEEKADVALTKAQKEFPQAQLVFCSVKGDELYQIGI